jgi:hypothetical protein
MTPFGPHLQGYGGLSGAIEPGHPREGLKAPSTPLDPGCYCRIAWPEMLSESGGNRRGLGASLGGVRRSRPSWASGCFRPHHGPARAVPGASMNTATINHVGPSGSPSSLTLENGCRLGEVEHGHAPRASNSSCLDLRLRLTVQVGFRLSGTLRYDGRRLMS